MMKRTKLIHLFGILALLLLMPGQAFAQNLRVEGKVLDELGEGLIGAGVVIQGTNTGAITDLDGNFVLSVPRGTTLEVSCVGYATKLVQVTGAKLTIQMELDTSALDESVVIAYGQQKKVTITGAVSAVSGEGLMKAPVANVANALQGNLPGVSAVQPSGMPGADDPVIRIRGVGSLNSAEPLVLVDGVERPFSQLDPNEIESISVLKDASATAVFGVRGANGVILVTTKRGNVGKASVTATANASVQTISKFIDFADSYTYGKMYNYTQITDALPVSQWPASASIADYSQYEGYGIKFKQNVMEHFRLKDMPTTFPSMDWIKYIMNNSAWQEQANVNVNGGTEKVRYFVSAGFLNQDSLFKTFSSNKNETFNFKRLNYRANLDIEVSKRSQLSITLGGRMQDRNTMGGGEGFLFRYLQGATPYAGSGVDAQGRHIIADQNLVGTYDRDALSNYYNLGYVNESTNVLNFDIQYKLDLGFITQGLDFKVKASYNSEYTARKNRENGYGTGLTYVATLNGAGEEVLRKENITWPTPYSEAKWGSRNWYTEASFNYNRKFGQHNIGALILYNQSKTYYPWDSDNSLYQSIPKGYVGLVGRVTYDYATKYLLDFNIGYNGSENFAPDKRYGVFPSISLGWIPSNEKWWEPVSKVVSYLKLRGSWGLVGNDYTNGARFLYLPGAWQFYTGTMTVNPQKRGANFGTSGNWLQAVKELTSGNPNVTWETASKVNIGVDATFFSKLHAYVDVFWEDRKGILVSNASTLPAVTSLPSSYVNEGRVKNQGFEVTLNWEDKIGEVYYSISPNVSFARNKVIEMLEVEPMYEYLKRTGLPVGQRFGYDLFEFYQPGTEDRYQEKYGTPMPDQTVALKYGDAVYVDLNGDGVIDANDQKPMGYTDNPELTFSLNASLHWKGLDFSMLWTGADHVSRTLNGYFRDQFGSTNTSALTQWVADNSWTTDNPNAILPRISFTNRVHNNHDSQAWMIDSKYIRLKNVEIGYTFKKIKSMPFFNYIRVYLSGQNLLTFSQFDGNDPEAPGSGLDFGVRYPMTRVVNIGAQLNF